MLLLLLYSLLLNIISHRNRNAIQFERIHINKLAHQYNYISILVILWYLKIAFIYLYYKAKIIYKISNNINLEKNIY